MLTYVDRGGGAPILLLNGGMMSIAAWDPIAMPFEGRHRVIRCDFRGQLLSPGTPPPAIAGHADDIVELLDHLGVARAHVAGTSFGALVGMKLAADHPSRVSSLVALTATDRITAEMWAGTEALAGACRAAVQSRDGGPVFDVITASTFSPSWRTTYADLLRARRAAVATWPPAWFTGVEGLLESLRDLDLTPDLPRIACPTLVIAGEQDVTFPPAHSRALAAGIRGAQLEIVPGAPHGLVVEQPDLVAALIERHVKANES